MPGEFKFYTNIEFHTIHGQDNDGLVRTIRLCDNAYDLDIFGLNTVNDISNR